MIVVSRDGKPLAQRVNEKTRDHAGTINTMIDEALKDAGIALNDLHAISVCGGPGSYTGLRIGMATAKGLCYTLNIPLINDNRLTLLAHQAWRAHHGYHSYVALLKAREKEYFITIHDANFNCILAPQHIPEEQLSLLPIAGETIFVISAVLEEVTDFLPVGSVQNDKNERIAPEAWCFSAFEKYNCNLTVNLYTAEPFYLKQVYTHK